MQQIIIIHASSPQRSRLRPFGHRKNERQASHGLRILREGASRHRHLASNVVMAGSRCGAVGLGPPVGIHIHLFISSEINDQGTAAQARTRSQFPIPPTKHRPDLTTLRSPLSTSRFRRRWEPVIGFVCFCFFFFVFPMQGQRPGKLSSHYRLDPPNPPPNSPSAPPPTLSFTPPPAPC